MHHTAGPAGTGFNHNGDFSGAVLFQAEVPDRGRLDLAAPFGVFARAALAAGTEPTVSLTVRGSGGSFTHQYTDDEYVVTLPTADVQALVAERAMSERISALEDATYEELFLMVADVEIADWALEPISWN